MQACFAAFRRKLLPSHLVNCLPGSEAMTEKAWLFWTLRAAYGKLAAAIAPEVFQLPREYFQLARTLVQVGGDARRTIVDLRAVPGRGYYLWWLADCQRIRFVCQNDRVVLNMFEAFFPFPSSS